jgi:hypothetical protein
VNERDLPRTRRKREQPAALAAHRRKRSAEADGQAVFGHTPDPADVDVAAAHVHADRIADAFEKIGSMRERRRVLGIIRDVVASVGKHASIGSTIAEIRIRIRGGT